MEWVGGRDSLPDPVHRIIFIKGCFGRNARQWLLHEAMKVWHRTLYYRPQAKTNGVKINKTDPHLLNIFLPVMIGNAVNMEQHKQGVSFADSGREYLYRLYLGCA